MNKNRVSIKTSVVLNKQKAAIKIKTLKYCFYTFIVFTAAFEFIACAESASRNQSENLSAAHNSNLNRISNTTVNNTPISINSNQFSQTPKSEESKKIQLSEAGNPNLNTSNKAENTYQEQDISTTKLKIPVVGIRPEELRDTFDDARSEGRVHDAIDIIAPANTPVIAAANGEIVKFFDSDKGGITIYQLSADRKFVYYYAHLKNRAENLQENTLVKQGTIIGYVGDTGNAGPGNYHLHFSIWKVTDPKHFWDGENINPYPLLR